LTAYRILVLVDNSAPRPTSMWAEYGLSLLIEKLNGDSLLVLFDTGTSGDPLLHNLELADVDPREIDYIVLSHRHYDHTGGLVKLLEARKGKPIMVITHPDLFVEAYGRGRGGRLRYIGSSFTADDLRKLGARLVLTRGYLELAEDMGVTGEIPRKWGPSHTWGLYRMEAGFLREDPLPDDMSMVLKLGEEVVVVTGCGHAGVENIVEHSLEVTGAKRLHGIIGGLHLITASADRVREVASYLSSKKPRFVAAIHCTGPLAQAYLKEELGEAYRLSGVGDLVQVSI